MKCCGNCEWSISPCDEEQIMEEQCYDEDDLARPRAGDCCLNVEHNGRFVCDNHKYLNDGLETYVLYDDKYMGCGYFIIYQYNGEIIKFLKIYKTECFGFPSYSIRGYEADCTDKEYLLEDKKFREIEFEVSNFSSQLELFEVIKNLANRLNNDRIYTINYEHGMNNFCAEVYKDTAFLILAKDIWKVKMPSDFIDVQLGDYLTCDKYEEVSLLFNDLAEISSGIAKEDTIKKILKISK